MRKLRDNRSPRQIMTQEVILTVPLLSRIWGIARQNALKRLTSRHGLYYLYAYKDQGRWQIRTDDFNRIQMEARGKG